MVTYQDLVGVGDNEQERMRFIRATIRKYQAEPFYKTAEAADLYDRKMNPDIRAFTKTIFTVTGRQVPDLYSTDYRVGRAFFPFVVMQQNQYLLANGVSWSNPSTPDRLGTRRASFDSKLQDAGHKALVGGCSYGFWNLDHIDVFSSLEFVPLYDEEDGTLKAGIRFWQIDRDKPFRATLYELDGYTEYIWGRRVKIGLSWQIHTEGEVLQEKRAYIVSTTKTMVDDDVIDDGHNYPTFPIVPFWASKKRQSELVGLREQIFVYDMIKSGFANTVEDASYIFWAISNAPGMDERAMAEFMGRVKKLHIAVTEDETSSITPQQIEAPYQSRETLLGRLEKDLFKDAMAFDPEQVVGGAATATQIKAAYENLDLKTDDYEYCVLEFIYSIMELAGVDDEPTFTRSKNVNITEEVQTLAQLAGILDEEYITRKILTVLGDGDKADEVMERKIADEVTISRLIPEAVPEEEGEDADNGEGSEEEG